MSGDGLGYLGWVQPMARQMYLGGQPLSSYSYFEWVKDPDPGVLRMLSGGHVVQRIFRGDSAPASLRPQSGILKFLPQAIETDYQALQRAEQRAAAVLFFPELVHIDSWDIAQGGAQLSTSRFLPWTGGVPGVTTTTHPARAWLNGAEQAVVYDAIPSTGQIAISTSLLSQHRAVETPTLAPGDVVELAYYPVYAIVVSSPDRIIADVNNMTYQASMVEVLTGDWT